MSTTTPTPTPTPSTLLTATNSINMDMDAKKSSSSSISELDSHITMFSTGRAESTVEVFAKALVDPPKKTRLQRFFGFLVSRKFIDDVKGSLAYLLAFIWIFWNSTNQILQARVESNIILTVIVHSPAQTIGSYLDTSLILILGLGLASLSWTLVNIICGTTYWAMTIVLFIIVYCFSYMRGLSPERFFALGIVGPLLAFTACTSTLGVNKAFGSAPDDSNNYSNGGQSPFDYVYLIRTIESFLVGAGITFVINLFIFPHFAEHSLKSSLTTTFQSLSKAIALTIKPYSLASTPELDTAKRVKILDEVLEQISELKTTLAEAHAEIYFSRFSIQDYENIVDGVVAVLGLLKGVNVAVLDDGILDDVLGSEIFKRVFKEPMDSSLVSVYQNLDLVLEYCRCVVCGKGKHVLENDKLNKVKTGILDAREALKKMESKQYEILVRIFHNGDPTLPINGNTTTEIGTAKVNSDKGTIAQEGIAQVNVFVLSMLEILDEIESIFEILSDGTKVKRVRFYYRHFLPVALFNGRSGEKKKNVGFGKRVHAGIVRITKGLVARESIFALNNFYYNWYMQSSFITLLVAITPNIGQSNITYLVNLLGSGFGNIWGYVSLIAWGVGYNALRDNPKIKDDYCWGWGCSDPYTLPQVGLCIMVVVLALPMNHVYLHGKGVGGFGLLALLAFSGMLLGNWLYRKLPTSLDPKADFYRSHGIPVYDAPEVRLYKLITTLSIAITFALLFSIAFYPNLARRTLRIEIAGVLRRINAYYADLMNCAFMEPPSSSPSTKTTTTSEPTKENQDRLQLPLKTQLRLRKTHLDIESALQKLYPLLIFSAVEFRVEGPFQRGIYKEIVDSLGNLVDRLGSARVILGGKVFDDGVRGLVASEGTGVNRARREMREAVRLLIYIYSSSMIAKQPLPHDLPNATRARNKVFKSFVNLMQENLNSESESSAEDQHVVATGGHQTKRVSRSDSLVSFEGHSLSGKVNWGVGKDRLKEILMSDSWNRFFSFSTTLRIFTVKVDNLAIPIKTLFGELPPFNYNSETDLDTSSEENITPGHLSLTIDPTSSSTPSSIASPKSATQFGELPHGKRGYESGDPVAFGMDSELEVLEMEGVGEEMVAVVGEDVDVTGEQAIKVKREGTLGRGSLGRGSLGRHGSKSSKGDGEEVVLDVRI
ncbi:hypothetical protein HDU76_006077 [Blyttiomyces sp. JEL0837]|nr:hypothetical protein HDU76_006077 [Blyttiomyces sp. JEL0837]